MTEPTHKSLVAAQRSVTLLLNPQTPQQRAFWTCRGDRANQQAHAVQRARHAHPQAPLAWLQPDGSLVDIITPDE